MTLSTSSWSSYPIYTSVSVANAQEHPQKKTRTGVLGVRDDFGKELREIRQVLAEEVGLQNQGFPGMVRRQLAAQQLRFADDAQSRSFRRVLCQRGKLAQQSEV
jgi:hypothetical protein